MKTKLKNKKSINSKGITQLTLIISIISIFLLIGITISLLTLRNESLINISQTKNAEIKAEMKEDLIFTLSELQKEKPEGVTLADVTQEYLEAKLQNYTITITENTTENTKEIKLEKDGINEIFIIDAQLNILENNGNIKFSYEISELNGNTVSILIHVQDEINGLKKVTLSDDEILANGTKKEIGIDYQIELDKEYKIPITSENEEVTEETIFIDSSKIYVWNKYGTDLQVIWEEVITPGQTVRISTANYCAQVNGELNTTTGYWPCVHALLASNYGKGAKIGPFYSSNRWSTSNQRLYYEMSAEGRYSGTEIVFTNCTKHQAVEKEKYVSNNELIGQVISFNENEYPEDGEQGGFWYTKVLENE